MPYSSDFAFATEPKSTMEHTNAYYWDKALQGLGRESKTSKTIENLFKTIRDESNKVMETMRRDTSITVNDTIQKLLDKDFELEIEKQIAIWKLYQKYEKRGKVKVNEELKEDLRAIAKLHVDRDQPAIHLHKKLLLICQARQKQSTDRDIKIRFLGIDFALQKLWGNIIQTLTRSQRLVDVATSANPTASLVWSIFKLILEVPIRYEDQAGAMLIGIEKTLAFMNRAAQYEQFIGRISREDYSQTEFLEEVLVAIYSRILEFLASTAFTHSMNLFRRLWEAIWKQTDIVNFEKDIVELELQFERYARNSHRRLIQDSVDDANATLEKLQSQLKRLDVIIDYYGMRKREDVLAWLSQNRYLDNHYRARRGYVKNTGNWVFKRAEYQRWYESDLSRLLWIYGKPGAGKTKLITRVVDELIKTQRQFDIRTPLGSTHARKPEEESFSSDESEDDDSLMSEARTDDLIETYPSDSASSNNADEDVSVNEADFEGLEKTQLAYFYCLKGGDESRKLSRWVLGDLIRQLADNYHPLPKEVLSVFEEKGRPTSRSCQLSQKDYLKLMKCMMPSDTTTILILDALDECIGSDDQSGSNGKPDQAQEIKALLRVFRALLKSDCRVKILISSQPNEIIETCIGKLKSLHPEVQSTESRLLELAISATDNQADILKLVRTRIQEKESDIVRGKSKPFMSAELKKGIIQVFTEKSDGMFQWANWHITELLDLPSGQDIAKALPKLPEGLKNTYIDTFKRIDDDVESYKRIALQVIQWLIANGGSCDKSVVLEAISQDLTNLPVERLHYDESVVIKACRNFVAEEGGVFRFSHLSILEYCVAHRSEADSGHLHVAEMCLWIMEHYNSPAIDIYVHSDESCGTESLLSLWNYAYEHWYRHFKLCGKEQQANLVGRLESFIGEGLPSTGCTHWLIRLASDLISSSGSIVVDQLGERFFNDPEAWTPVRAEVDKTRNTFNHLWLLRRALTAGLLAKIKHIFLKFLKDGEWPYDSKMISQSLFKAVRFSPRPRRWGALCEINPHSCTKEDLSQMQGLLFLIRAMEIKSCSLVIPSRNLNPSSADYHKKRASYRKKRVGYLLDVWNFIFPGFLEASRKGSRDIFMEYIQLEVRPMEYVQPEPSRIRDSQCRQELARLSLLLLATTSGHSMLDWELIDDTRPPTLPMSDHTTWKFALAAVDTQKAAASLLRPPKCHRQVFYDILVSHGADLNFVPDVVSAHDKYGTPLIAAVATSDHEDTQSISWLLSHGARVNLKAMAGEYGTALIAACGSGHYKAVRTILRVPGIDPNAVTLIGPYRTALIAACVKDRLDIAKELLHAGTHICPGPSDCRENNGLYEGVQRSSVALIRRLWKRFRDSSQEQERSTILTEAKEMISESPRTPVMKALILHLIGQNHDETSKEAIGEVQRLQKAVNYDQNLSERAKNLLEELGYLNPDAAMVNGFKKVIVYCDLCQKWYDAWATYLDLLDDYVDCSVELRIQKADGLEANGVFQFKRSNSALTEWSDLLYSSEEDDNEADEDDSYDGEFT